MFCYKSIISQVYSAQTKPLNLAKICIIYIFSKLNCVIRYCFVISWKFDSFKLSKKMKSQKVEKLIKGKDSCLPMLPRYALILLT